MGFLPPLGQASRPAWWGRKASSAGSVVHDLTLGKANPIHRPPARRPPIARSGKKTALMEKNGVAGADRLKRRFLLRTGNPHVGRMDMQVFGRPSQEQIVFALALALCAAFALALPGFLTAGNILNLVRSVSILGILGVAMGLVVIGRGIDLSLVAAMAISVAWALQLMTAGRPLIEAVALGLAFSLAVGMINGILIAYVEI